MKSKWRIESAELSQKHPKNYILKEVNDLFHSIHFLASYGMINPVMLCAIKGPIYGK